MMKYLQKLGKALMLPVACLPICGILMGIGYALCPSTCLLYTSNRLEKASVKAIFFSSLTNPCTRFVNSLVYAGVGIVGAFLAIKGRISVGPVSYTHLI